MGNNLCMDENSLRNKKNQKKPANKSSQISGNNTNQRNNERLNSIIDLNEYKLPSDPKEKKLFQSVAAKEQDGDEDKITLQSFRIIRVVGSGAFGKVYLVNKKGTEEIFAMKVYNKMTLYEKNVILNTISEKNILKNMNSGFIVKLHYAFQAAQKLYLMMDFMVGGELYYHLKKAKKFDEQRTKFYIAQVILAIECLHQNNIIYRDLKLENILLGYDGYIKLTDFGLSKEGIKDKDLTNTLCGTAEYMAPEQIMNEGHNKMADFWQIGVLTYEMLYGTTPFFNEFRPNKDDIFNDIISGKYTFPQYFSENAKSFCRGLLQKDVKKRLGQNGFYELKNHPFFSDLDWESLQLREIEPQFKPPLRSNVDLQNFNPRLVKNTLTDLNVKDDRPYLNEEIESQFRGFTFVKDDHMNTDVPNDRNSTSDYRN